MKITRVQINARALKLFKAWEKGFDTDPQYRKRVLKAVQDVRKEDRKAGKKW